MQSFLKLFSLLMVLHHVCCLVDDKARFKPKPKRWDIPERVLGKPRALPKFPKRNPPRTDRRKPAPKQSHVQIPIGVLDRLQGVKSTTDFLKAFGGEKFIKGPNKGKGPLGSKGPGGGKIDRGRPSPSKESEGLSGGVPTSEDESGVDFENQYCWPRPSIVHVKQPDPHEGIIFPFCVKLQRCHGCCGIMDDIQHCAPVQWKNVTFTAFKLSWSNTIVRSVIRPAKKPILKARRLPIYERLLGDDSIPKSRYQLLVKNSQKPDAPRRMRRAARMQEVEEIKITMVTHTQCGCQCTLDPSICGPKQTFVEKHCRCECKKTETCQAPFEWDEQECKCVCQQQINKCKSTMYWDREICGCKCWNRRCKKGKVQDPKTCRCVYKLS